MRVVLIMPQSERYRYQGSFRRSLRYAPLTLTVLAALVPPELNADIRLIDEGVEFLNADEEEADIVGITCITPTAYRTYEIAAKFRARGIPVVLGGVHPTLLPDEALQHCDAIVTGYAEKAWPRLLRDFAAGRMQRRYDQGPNLSMANMPEPRRDLLKKSGYFTLNTVQAVRGCPWRCSFCVAPYAWPGYNHRPIREVVAEVEKLQGKQFLFLDLSPIENIEYAKQLYRELIPLKRHWGGLATVRITDDPELLDLASKSGCRGLLIGFESVNQETVNRARKRFNRVGNYVDKVKKLHDHGIAINGCFVLGLDGDDESIFERTVEFVEKTAIDLPRFAVPTPYAGTPLYTKYKQEGRLLTEDWNQYDVQTVVFRPEKMSPERLQEGLLWTWREAYTLPSITRRIWNSAASMSTAMFTTSVMANLGYRYYQRFLPKALPAMCEIDPWDAAPEAAVGGR